MASQAPVGWPSCLLPTPRQRARTPMDFQDGEVSLRAEGGSSTAEEIHVLNMGVLCSCMSSALIIV